MLFRDRSDAGKRLAAKLMRRRDEPDLTVLALPRGGVPVAYEIAQALDAPLELLVVRKLGFPAQPELAMGAIASGGGLVLNRDLIKSLRVDNETLESVKAAEFAELRRREAAYGCGEPKQPWSNVIVVDDGLATGATMLAAVQALRQIDVESITVAVPCGAKETCALIGSFCDRVVCLEKPENFGSVGQWYENFSQTDDEEVTQLLHENRSLHRSR